MAEIKLIVLGAGRHAREVVEFLGSLSGIGAPINLLGCMDEVSPPGPWCGTRIIGGFDRLGEVADDAGGLVHYISAVGDNDLRRRFVEIVQTSPSSAAFAPWSLIHPFTYVGKDVKIGAGTCLAPGVVVTTHVEIGQHCIVNVKASLSHDCVVGDFTTINPGATICGNVRIGDGCVIGAGATVSDKVTIGAGTIVGAGAVVISDLPPSVTAVGVPARVIKSHR